MRRAIVLAALAIGFGVHAMPLGLRSAAWGVAPANRRAAVEAAFPSLDETASAEDVAAILGEAEDSALAENIVDADGYGAFREWARCAGAASVKASGTAWLSYALGAGALIGKDITSNDVHIVSFRAEAAGGGQRTDRPASFAFEVAIDGVSIGGGSVAVETLKENLKKVVGVEGAAMLDESAFSSDNIEITFEAPIDGKARFTATPPADAGNTFFLRVKVR